MSALLSVIVVYWVAGILAYCAKFLSSSVDRYTSFGKLQARRTRFGEVPYLTLHVRTGINDL
jgi:hypothetical protein